MLSEEERREIDEEAAQAGFRRGASIEALKVIQRHRGWVSDEGLRDAARELGMTPAELDDVATFYNLIFREPVGRHIILICESVSCWVMGYAQMLNHLSEKLGIAMGETTGDGRFTLLPVPCLGICDRAPAMLIDEDLYTDLTPEKIDEALAKYV
jgi:NADH-quinone oxidoreductase subunit E